MAFKLATFTDENGNLFAEQVMNSTEEEITLVRAMPAKDAENIISVLNKQMHESGFWNNVISETGLYNLDWFNLDADYLDDDGNFVAIKNPKVFNASITLPEEWSKLAIYNIVEQLKKSNFSDFFINIDHDCNFVFITMDLEKVRETLISDNNG